MALPFLTPAATDDLPAPSPTAKPSASQRKPKRRKAVSAARVEATTSLASFESDDPGPDFDPANLRRCRGCGAKVYLWPCLACQHRRSA